MMARCATALPSPTYKRSLDSSETMQRKQKFCALVLAATAGLTACSREPTEKEPTVTVQTAVARKTSIAQVITTEAILFPRNQAAITPKITAPVRKFHVNRGSRVHRGQLLAELENRDLAAAVAENKGAYE